MNIYATIRDKLTKISVKFREPKKRLNIRPLDEVAKEIEEKGEEGRLPFPHRFAEILGDLNSQTHQEYEGPTIFEDARGFIMMPAEAYKKNPERYNNVLQHLYGK